MSWTSFFSLELPTAILCLSNFDLSLPCRWRTFLCVLTFFLALHLIKEKGKVVSFSAQIRLHIDMSSDWTALQNEVPDIKWSVSLNLVHSFLLYGLLLIADKSWRGWEGDVHWEPVFSVATVKIEGLCRQSFFHLISLKGPQGVWGSKWEMRSYTHSYLSEHTHIVQWTKQIRLSTQQIDGVLCNCIGMKSFLLSYRGVDNGVDGWMEVRKKIRDEVGDN